MNSFRFLQEAIEYEVRRQIELIEDGGKVVQATRLYDPDTGEFIAGSVLPFLDPSKKGAALGKASSQIADYTNSMKHIKHIANHNNSKN